MNRIFHRFSAHDTVSITGVDHTRRIIRGISVTTGEAVKLSFFGLPPIAHSTLVEGHDVQVQYGTVSTSKARDSNWKCRHGDVCITALKHSAPMISRLGARLLEWKFGGCVAIAHIENFRDGASTLQTQAEAWIDDRRIAMTIKAGRLTVEMLLGGKASIDNECLSLIEKLPMSMCQMSPGTAVGRLVAHPALMDPGLVMGDVQTDDLGTMIQIKSDYLTPDEAISLLARDALRIAA